MVEQLDIGVLGRVIEAMRAAHSIDVYGVGASGLVAVDLEHKPRRMASRRSPPRKGYATMTSAALLSRRVRG
jgi:DNA-binding MurR/RpiR family transcriptional regulator